MQGGWVMSSAIYGMASALLVVLGCLSLVTGSGNAAAAFAGALVFAVWELNETIKRRPSE